MIGYLIFTAYGWQDGSRLFCLGTSTLLAKLSGMLAPVGDYPTFDAMLQDYSALIKPVSPIYDMMEKLTDLHKRANWANGVMAHAKMIQENDPFRQIREMSEMFKMFHNPALNRTISSIAAVKQLAMPFAEIATINSVIADQLRISNAIKGIQGFAQAYPSNQLRDLQFALGASSGNIARDFLMGRHLQGLNTFSNIAADVANWAEQIDAADGENLTFDLEELKQLISALFLQVDSIGKGTRDKFLAYIGVIGFILSIISFVQSNSPNSNALTKQDMIELRDEIHKEMVSRSADTRIHRQILRNCMIYLRPNTNSYISARLFAGTDVIVLSCRHKWVYVSFINPEDGLVQTGWIMKKYLSRLR